MTLEEATEALRRARQSLSDYDHRSDLAREQGRKHEPAFYETYANARTSERLAYREVAKLTEAAAKAAEEAARYERAPGIVSKRARTITKRCAPVVVKKRAGGRR